MDVGGRESWEEEQETKDVMRMMKMMRESEMAIGREGGKGKRDEDDDEQAKGEKSWIGSGRWIGRRPYNRRRGSSTVLYRAVHRK